MTVSVRARSRVGPLGVVRQTIEVSERSEQLSLLVYKEGVDADGHHKRVSHVRSAALSGCASRSRRRDL